jgi:Cu+-exporting ATPase
MASTPVAAVEKTGFAALESVHATSPSSQQFQALFSITGMTCSACVRAITETLEAKPYVRKANVILLASSATVDFEGHGHAEQLAETIEDLGYGVVVEEVKPFSQRQAGKAKLEAQFWKASFTVEGMADSSCASLITQALEREHWVTKVEVTSQEDRVTVEFENKRNISEIPMIIKSVDDGYYTNLIDLVRVGNPEDESVTRTVSILVNGISNEESLLNILSALTTLDHPVTIDKQPTLNDPILAITYTPQAPQFTIRHILTAIRSADLCLKANIHHPPTPEERARAMHARERLHVIYRVLLSFMAAIPSFIIGIVLMSLVPSKNSSRVYLMKTWANVSRAQWALFLISTPVYFFAADLFHRRAFKELVALWRPGSSTPVFRRFYRFGSMNLLMSLGTSIAYFASIAELIITSRKPAHDSHVAAYQSFYFDSIVFLTLFLLIGRLIEAWSRAKTADAVMSLGQLRPTMAIIYNSIQLDKTQPDAACTTSVDEIETGDIILVPHGASPPCDGILLSDRGSFDESSLTGEARLIEKTIGDDVLSGTVNRGNPVFMRAIKIVGASMLDQIIQGVREGQARRAPVERIGDTVTSYFVPVITSISISTWIVWLTLGETGSLPRAWLDVESGGWPYWSLQFSIAVFIIACPCGFGLAAPTAMFVGGAIAAKNGILAKGGGEAFQEASMLDLVVFDKTGTLTEGGKPSVTEWEDLTTLSSTEIDTGLLQSLIRATEEKSSHPIAAAVVKFLKDKNRVSIRSTTVEELPGRGMKGLYTSDLHPGMSYMVLVGNERLMFENNINIDGSIAETLESWKTQGKSVVLVAVRMTDIDASTLGTWALRLIAAVSDPIRPESTAVVESLRGQGIDIWMISGDNETTARAVGQMVGIPPEKVIAGVLPEQKAEMIQYLQRSQAKRGHGWLSRDRSSQSVTGRAIVAMVGDGVNDSPALTVADVGIAIGSGSDVAISSADFVLMSSDLSAVVVLIQLSRAVFRRIKFNFGWALGYNLVALPIAAGVLYPVTRHGSHVRLDPVWASLAMALSSISVVTSSLALKTELPYVGFRKVAPKIKDDGAA